MTATAQAEPSFTAGEGRRRRRLRRWTGGLALFLLAVLSVVAQLFADLDPREESLFHAWHALVVAWAIWLVTDLAGWFSKLFFALCLLGSLQLVGEGLGLWHSVCVENYKPTSTGGKSGYNYCLPHWGISPDYH